jgi:nucleoside-diphosphate-sugar epimerase
MLLCGIKKDPLLTRYSVNVLSRSSTFDISAAKKELGYKPVVPFDVAMDRFFKSVTPSPCGNS